MPAASAPTAAKLAYSVKEACGSLSIFRSALYELIRSGALPVVKIGTRTLIRVSDLEAFLASRMREAA